MEDSQHLSTTESETSLYISTSLDENALPAIIRSLLSLAPSPAEKDMLLMATLTACGSVMPNLYCRYGIAAKRYYPNLQLFIVGSAASGKGIANLALELVKPIHDAQPLIIPGDATYPAFYQQLAKQNGRAYIHESEGSVITDIWRSSTANYNTALRKAAEHEPISRSRCRETSVIACPQVSMVLTGTFSQYHALVPSIENGYFSRLLTLIINDVHPFSGQYVQISENSTSIISTAAQQLFHLYESLLFAHPREFQLTPAQKERLGTHLETAYPTLIRMLGEDFHSVVLRLAVHIERIAMILTALRLTENSLPFRRRMSGEHSNQDRQGLGFICSPSDYQTAELIGNKLVLHMAQAYQLIKGTEKTILPTAKPLDQKQILLSLLPAEFESKLLIEEAKAQGIPQSTVMRWCSQWIENGLLHRPSFGHYKKIV